jgi:hypothetical protein
LTAAAAVARQTRVAADAVRADPSGTITLRAARAAVARIAAFAAGSASLATRVETIARVA